MNGDEETHPGGYWGDEALSATAFQFVLGPLGLIVSPRRASQKDEDDRDVERELLVPAQGLEDGTFFAVVAESEERDPDLDGITMATGRAGSVVRSR